MKQFLLFSAFILFFLSPILSFSQNYKVDERKIYFWNNAITIPAWEHQSTELYTYGNDGDKETNLLSLSFPGGEKLYQQKKTYNASNDIILNVFQFWNPGLPVPGWQDTSQIIYSYVGGKLSTETTQNYISMGWQNTTQTEYNYEGNNLKDATTLLYNLTTMVFEIAHSSNQELYMYSGDDVTKETNQHWETGTGWVVDEIFETTYSSPGVPIMTMDSNWDAFTNTWEIERAIITYVMGLINKVKFELSDGEGGWILDSQVVFEYPSATSSIITQQDWVDLDWVDTDRELNTYDANGNLKVYILEDAISGPWEGYYRVDNDYSVAAPFSLSAESFNKENFKVFPNPVSDVINLVSSVWIEKIELFDILGKKVLSSSNTKQLNVEHLKSGIYVLKVFSDNRSDSKKIVIN